ncbi:hypothetical protein B9Z07_14570 [Burkholderia cenocepacia]|uniref:Uncharacterized protein n=1 Tax=Burkholderia cenocepacia TaxID=95486 RepID=A0AAD0J152_9BURK|nr:hypothetical protein B9Z07_14570 [Burkholderia cenocepacia]PRE36132.1 hypothetical protein C6P63_15090 [Burkholderia cenocepacia]RQU70889.1 hypothetical protein DF049_30440 [Burkholderia cenocepacia]RQU94962.1 hypothetical protein DF042_31850 [Burkholderia cenocepacia]
MTRCAAACDGGFALLCNFAAIRYAFSVSFVVMDRARHHALPDELPVQFDKAALSIQVSNPMGSVS